MLGLAARTAAAQGADSSFFQRWGLDRLQFVALGGSVGRVDATQAEPANIYQLYADYGELARNWRVVFSVSYWESQLSERTVQTFIDTLHKNIVDPGGDATILTSPISLYDVTFSGSLRWQSSAAVTVRPYIGIGAAAHVINAEGRLIDGTFVERSLDAIAAGFFVNGGILIRPWGRVIFEAEARADLLSGFRSVQLQAGAMYYFGRRRTTPQ